MFKPIALFALLSLLSCNRAEDRFARLQHEFWEQFGRQDFYEIQLPAERLLLPLPPRGTRHGEQLTGAKKLLESAQGMPSEALSHQSQTRLLQIRSALEDLVHRSGGVFFDPSRCGLSSHLRRYAEQPECGVLLANIPAYYAEVERRWQMPDARFVPKAVDEALGALDLLTKIGGGTGEQSSGEAAAARWAVKDFIGLCQSSALLR